MQKTGGMGDYKTHTFNLLSTSKLHTEKALNFFWQKIICQKLE